MAKRFYEYGSSHRVPAGCRTPMAKRRRGVLQGFDDSILRPRCDRHPRSEVLDGLVMLAVEPTFAFAEKRVQPAAGFDPDGMGVGGHVGLRNRFPRPSGDARTGDADEG